MKKIVSILAVAALATSVFAADVSAQLKLGTNIYTNKDGKNEVLSTPASTGWDNNNTFFKLAGNLDAAGAEICVSKEDAALYGYSLWFSPIENLKVTVGNNTVGTIDKGTFAWWAQSVKLENVNGIKVNYNIGDLGLEFLSATDALLDFNKSGADAIGSFWLGATYGLGDLGTVQVFAAKDAQINAYGVGGYKNDPTIGHDGFTFGVAYDHMPWQQTGFYGDAFVAFKDNFAFEEVGAQIGGQYVADGLALRLTNMFAFGDKYGNPNTFDYGFVGQASYAIGDYTPYLKLLGNGILGKTLECELGVDTNFGGCAINAAINIPLNFADMGSTKIAIPVSCTVSF